MLRSILSTGTWLKAVGPKLAIRTLERDISYAERITSTALEMRWPRLEQAEARAW
jgi:hypothetical protein